MKKLILLVGLIVLTGVGSYGQMTAPDWTHADCSLVNHQLYSYLDSQEVVVMLFVMGCSSCTDAGTALMSVKNEYDVSNPGKVNFFLMDYYPANSCVDVNGTWSTYNFDAYFAGCWAEKEVYYPTLYPMPAVVIAAGNYHTVIYNDLSWQTSDTTLIKQAIDQFFNTVQLENQSNDQNMLLYPNPAQDVLYTNLAGFNGTDVVVKVYDLMGHEMQGIHYRIDKNLLMLDVADFNNGNYILELVSSENIVRRIFVRH